MKLFTPGPVQVKKSILDVSALPIIFHRAIGFETLYSTCAKLLKKVFQSGDNHEILILNGSGTYANEVVIHSLISDNDKV